MFFQQKDSGNIYPRKKRRSPLLFILLGLLGVLAVAYIIYAINLPEPQAFANITPAISGQTDGNQSAAPAEPTDVAGVHFALTDPNVSPQPTNAPTTDVAGDLQPAALVLDPFEGQWAYALQTMVELRAIKDLSYAFPVMDIAHGDIMRDMDILSSLEVSSSESAEGTEDAIWSLTGTPATYAFRITGRDNLPLTGQINTTSSALYYEQTSADGSVQRFFELIQVGEDSFAQLMTKDGPYAGVLYFSLNAGGDLRCAVLNEQQLLELGGEPTRYFANPPDSWETFIGPAIAYFSATREEIAGTPLDELPLEQNQRSEPTAESAEGEGARVAASTPRPNSESASSQEDNSETLPNLPEEDGTGEEGDLPPLAEEGSQALD